MIFSCITLTILSPSSGLAVKDYIYAHKNFKCRRRDKPASNCKDTKNCPNQQIYPYFSAYTIKNANFAVNLYIPYQ